MTDSRFLNSLIAKPVRIVCKDSLASGTDAPLLLREVSELGLVGDNPQGSHFFPWTEVVEIVAVPPAVTSEDLALACCADSEP